MLFRYPKAFKTDYIRPEILIEVGPMSAMVPNREVIIQSYAGQNFPQVFEQVDIPVRTIDAKKTFWDKVSILHVEAHRPTSKNQQARYSRHYYDIYQMLNSAVKDEAMADLELLRSVVVFKNKFYPQAWANYAAAIEGKFKLMPESHIMDALRRDYVSMREMIHGEPPPPSFDDIMSLMGAFETELNEELIR